VHIPPEKATQRTTAVGEDLMTANSKKYFTALNLTEMYGSMPPNANEHIRGSWIRLNEHAEDARIDITLRSEE